MLKRTAQPGDEEMEQLHPRNPADSGVSETDSVLVSQRIQRDGTQISSSLRIIGFVALLVCVAGASVMIGRASVKAVKMVADPEDPTEMTLPPHETVLPERTEPERSGGSTAQYPASAKHHPMQHWTLHCPPPTHSCLKTLAKLPPPIIFPREDAVPVSGWPPIDKTWLSRPATADRPEPPQPAVADELWSPKPVMTSVGNNKFKLGGWSYYITRGDDAGVDFCKKKV